MSAGRLKSHALKAALVFAGIAAAGWALGRPVEILLGALSAWAAWHLVNIVRLYLWLRLPKKRGLRGFGIWREIFSGTGAMELRSRKQKKRYKAMIKDFSNVTDAFPDATLIIDENDKLNWFNASARNLLELEEERDIGRPVSNCIDSAAFRNWLASRGEDDHFLEMPYPEHQNNWFDISDIAIRGKRRLIILRDISELHHVERIRRDFVTNISHELRTPLTVMRGYLELLLDRPKDDLTDAVERMLTQAMQMQSMLDDLIELARLQTVESTGQESVVDVPAMLWQLREQAEEISRGDHEIRFDIDNSLMLSGFTSDLESAFRNLIVNALKYTPAGGRVSVNWHDGEEGPALVVCDTGIGIPGREIPRLTERFYRVDTDRARESGGTGLGLAIVKHVMNQHQARLAIESEYGVGSTFSCIFPAERKPI